MSTPKRRGVTIGAVQRSILYLLRDGIPRSSNEIDDGLELRLPIKRLGLSMNSLWRRGLIRFIPGTAPVQWEITDAGLWAI